MFARSLSSAFCEGRAGQGWSVVSGDLANVHCASPDGRAYVGFLPETPDAFHHYVVWRVSAPRGGRGWEQSFGSGTPSRPSLGSSPLSPEAKPDANGGFSMATYPQSTDRVHGLLSPRFATCY
ncbi:DUF317 domain-containing protein [Streptomyces olivoreticuli]